MQNANRNNGRKTSMTEASSSKVDFTPSRFTARAIRYEIPALLANPAVKVLHLPTNRLDEASAKCIAMMFEQGIGPPIEELHLSHTQRDENGDCGSSCALGEGNCTGSCEHGDEDPFILIASSLKHSHRVKKLVVSETPLNRSQISAISTTLYDIESLRTLVIRQCGLDHRAATKISCALASNKSVESFDFSNNPGVGNRGISSLAVSLEINTTLKKLKLSGTNVGIEGAIAVAAAIGSNPRLEVLDLSRNGIGDMGVSKLAIALKKNKSLRQLSLRQTNMSDIGALCIHLSLYDSKSLQSILNCNHSIRYLNLNSNDVSRKCLLDIETARRMNLATEKETMREKAAFFLESNTLGEDITVNCMPYLLSAVGGTEHITSLYNVVKNVNMPATFASRPCIVSPDSLFSNENNVGDHETSNVPTIIQVESCPTASSCEE